MRKPLRHPRTLDRQPDLFLDKPPTTTCAIPRWSALPESARQAAAALMMHLLVAHASGLASRAGGAIDER